MYKLWQKTTNEEIKTRVFEALRGNVNYNKQHSLGIPASYLDKKVFSQDDSFLKNAPFMAALVQNPNNIGCHTTGTSLSYFRGTQELEKELIEICAVDIFGGEPQQIDGYVAGGGTEANMQAIWIYRNYFMWDLGAKVDEIAILCSEDSHYSMDKSANVFMLDILKVPVEDDTRKITYQTLKSTLEEAIDKGKKFFIVVSKRKIKNKFDQITTFVKIKYMKEYYTELEIEQKVKYYKSLREKARRHFLALEYSSLGRGSQRYIALIYGCARDTIIKGGKELAISEGKIDYSRQRKVGGGRKKKK